VTTPRRNQPESAVTNALVLYELYHAGIAITHGKGAQPENTNCNQDGPQGIIQEIELHALTISS